VWYQFNGATVNFNVQVSIDYDVEWFNRKIITDSVLNYPRQRDIIEENEDATRAIKKTNTMVR